MAIIWADFPSGQQGLYGSSTSFMLNGIWAELASTTFGGPSLPDDPDPNVTGRVYAVTSTQSTKTTRIVIPSGAQTICGVGFRLWLPNLPQSTSAVPLTSFRTSSNTAICSVSVQPDGAVRAHSGDNGTTLGTSNPVLTANAWNHIEIKVTRDAAAGEIEVRVNGVSALSLDTLALGADDIGQIALVTIGAINLSGGPVYWKDFVLWDGTGSEGNDFQGSVAVHDLYTDADIALNWAPSTGSTGWDLIDEIPPVDTDYIQAGDPAPDPAKFSLTNLPDDVTSVRALIPIVRAVKTDGGDCNIQVGITPNDTNWDDGADRPITTAYTYWWDVSHLSPATAAPWTPAEVNAAYVRADRTL